MSCNVANVFSLLCDAGAAWGIVLETLAAAGVVFTIVLMVTLIAMFPRICDNAKRAVVPVQFIFLIGTLGIFGLTFAFIIRLYRETCLTRYFLFGVLFAICFSCLLAHASKLVRLVRGGLGISWLVMLIIVVVLSLVQIIIAILYVVVYLVKSNITCTADTNPSAASLNIDFVLILIYVLVLIAVTFILSVFSLCGPCKYWKRHGLHIYVTMFFSVGIWVAWIVMLLRGNDSVGQGRAWDDPVRAIALVANGWVFLLMYMVPELCLMSRCQPNCSKDANQAQPRLLRQTAGVENRVFTQEDNCQGTDSGRSSPSSPPRFDATLQMKDIPQPKDFSIPRPQQRPNSYMPYRSHDLSSM
ncbi:G-protein coupled receptor family C group 5 member D [Discoglossus pictus]